MAVGATDGMKAGGVRDRHLMASAQEFL